MWEIAYRITPEAGYFEKGEASLWELNVYFEAIHSIDFAGDGSVVVVYEIDGRIDHLEMVLEATPEKVVEYTITGEPDPLMAQIRFHPGDALEAILGPHRDAGVSFRFPLRYVRHDPATLSVRKVGDRAGIRQALEDVRDVASIEVRAIQPFDSETAQPFRTLTDRQQEVLSTAVELGYYEEPRGATHEDIATALECSPSAVGAHLRRIESSLVHSVVPPQ